MSACTNVFCITIIDKSAILLIFIDKTAYILAINEFG